MPASLRPIGRVLAWLALTCCACSSKTPPGSAPLTLTLTPSNGCSTPYAMDFGHTHVEVDPTQGARVSALRVDGPDILANATVTGSTIDWGATFWPSPQNWSWPPSSSIAAIDTNPYTCTANDASSFTLTSAPNGGTGPTIVVTKKFSADLTAEAFVIDYTMTNGGTAAIMVAPWEIARVPPGALSFYPGASAPLTKSGGFALPATTTDPSGVTWYQHSPTDTTQYKLFADGTGGWLAAVVGNDLFVKRFDDVPAASQPPTEAEIELYSSAAYVEVENQGAYQNLDADASLTWKVRWQVRAIPTGVTVGIGSTSLVEFVKNLVE